MGLPLNEGLSFVHNALVATALRDRIRVIASGKVNTGFSMATKIALGADMCNAARNMMFAIGCIQALRGNSNQCPTGVATRDPALVDGLHVADKSHRVARSHRETVRRFFFESVVHHEARQRHADQKLRRHSSATHERAVAHRSIDYGHVPCLRKRERDALKVCDPLWRHDTCNTVAIHGAVMAGAGRGTVRR